MHSVNTPNNITDINTNISADVNTDVNTDIDTFSNTHSTTLPEQIWLKLASVDNHTELSFKYADICKQHKQEKKWVLFINPEESSLEQLAHTHGVDISKVLCVSFKGKNKINKLLNEKSAYLDIEQIKSVLCRGNCSAVILSNASFGADEMAALDSCARLGETQCVLLKNTQRSNRKNEKTLSCQQVH
jgi:cell division inhibitor SulA